MKTYIKSYLAIFAVVAVASLSACEDGLEELSLSVIATPSTVNIGDTVHFQIAGNAETFAIYTGDRGHNYDSSFLAIADGQELDLASFVLPADSLDSAAMWLETVVTGFNIGIKNANEDIRNDTTIAEEDKVYQDTVVYEEMMADLREFIVDKDFANIDEASYYISRDAMPLLPVSTARQLVEDYFEDRGTILTPRRGFDTGVALDRDEPEYSYAYERPGTYTVTVIATEAGWKNYSGSGYKFDRTASASEYEYSRLIKQVEVTVQN